MMSDVPWWRRALALVAVATAMGLGIAAAVADQNEGHPAGPYIPGKIGAIIWVVREFFWHPAIRIPLLVVVVGGAMYAWNRRRERERQHDAGDPYASGDIRP